MEPFEEGGLTGAPAAQAAEAGYTQRGELGEAEDLRGLFERCARIRFSGLLKLVEGPRQAEVPFVAGAAPGADLFKLGAIWRRGSYRLEQRAVDLAGQLTGGPALDGSLAGGAWTDLMRHLEAGQLAGELELDSGDGHHGRARVRDGRLEEAELDGQAGADALAPVASWGRGTYRLRLAPVFVGPVGPPAGEAAAAVATGPVAPRPVALGAPAVGPTLPSFEGAGRIPLWKVEGEAAGGTGAQEPAPASRAALGPGGLPSIPSRPSLFAGGVRPSRPNPFAVPLRPSLTPGTPGERRGIGPPRTLPPVARPAGSAAPPRSLGTAPPAGAPSLLGRPLARPTAGSLRGEPPAPPLLGSTPVVSGWELPESIPPVAVAEPVAPPAAAPEPPATSGEPVAASVEGPARAADPTRWAARTPAAVLAVDPAGKPEPTPAPPEASAAALLGEGTPAAEPRAAEPGSAALLEVGAPLGPSPGEPAVSAAAPTPGVPTAATATRPDTVPLEVLVPSQGKGHPAFPTVSDRPPAGSEPPAAASPPPVPAPGKAGGSSRYVGFGIAAGLVALAGAALLTHKTEPAAPVASTTTGSMEKAPGPAATPSLPPPAPAPAARAPGPAPASDRAAPPPRAAAPPLPTDPVGKMIFAARKATTEGDRAEALRLFRAAYKINPDDPGFGIFVPMARGKTGVGRLLLEGPGVVFVDGVRFPSPRQLTLAAGPHRVQTGARTEEIVVDKGGAVRVAAEPLPAPPAGVVTPRLRPAPSNPPR